MKYIFLKRNDKKYINLINIETENDYEKIVLHIHGIGSHFHKKGLDCNYLIEERSKILKTYNIKSYAIEFHGHGYSDGERCYIKSIDELVEDIELSVKHIEEKHKDIPIYLIAESMGGAVVIHYIIKKVNNIRGVILLAPMCGIDDSMKPNILVHYFLMTLCYFFPKKQWIPNDGKFSEKCCPYKTYNIFSKRDPISYKEKHRLLTAKSCLEATDWIKKNGHKFDKPLLIIHGELDEITPNKNSYNFFKDVTNEDKEYMSLKNRYHSIFSPHNEDDKEPNNILNVIGKWISNK